METHKQTSPMINNTQIKFIKSLHQKKNRFENKVFIAEGIKIVNDLIENNFAIKELYATPSYLKTFHKLLEKKTYTVYEINEKTLSRISTLSSPNQVLAICKMIEYDLNLIDIKEKWHIVLDNINDPGNMGTIIRTAHWFGIDTIICSKDSVDVYNPKVVQSTMGSLAAVKIIYTDLRFFLSQINDKHSIWGSMLEGENFLKQRYPKSGLIIFGSESHGINKNLHAFIHYKISIGSNSIRKPDSLNVSVSAGIILSELFRQKSL